MTDFSRFRARRMAVVPLGIDMAGYDAARQRSDGDVPRRLLRAGRAGEGAARARRRLRPRSGGERAGATRRASKRPATWRRATTPYLDDVEAIARARRASADEFTYRGAVDRDGKLAFLRSLDVLSVPATYDEPKGMFLLEAMASGVPVVQPRRGAFTEVVEKTGGGLLVAPDDAEALAEGLQRCGAIARWRRRSVDERSKASARTTPSRSRPIG